ncbi:uncharacterized protein LOC144050855 isoform X2 [Vanacampus margaritifer]
MLKGNPTGVTSRVMRGQTAKLCLSQCLTLRWHQTHGEPNNQYDEFCFEMLSNGFLNDLKCDRQWIYICKSTLDNPSTPPQPTYPPTPPPCLPCRALQPTPAQGDVPSGIHGQQHGRFQHAYFVHAASKRWTLHRHPRTSQRGGKEVRKRTWAHVASRHLATCLCLGSFTFSLRADDGPVLTGLPDLQTQNTTLNSNSLVSWKVQGETQEDFPFVPQRDFEPCSSYFPQSIGGGDVGLMYVQLM